MSYDRFEQWTKIPASLDPELSVVIPAYNEAARIIPTIVSIAAMLSERTLDFEIILSDDGSSDDTARVVRNLGLRNLIVLDPGVNRGKGAAVRAGVRAANGRRILFSDADMSTPIREVGELMHRLDGGADVAIGSRAADGAVEQSKPLFRRIFSWGWRRISHVGLGLDIADTQCGFKLFTREAADALFSAGRIDGFSFDAELLFLSARFGFDVAEVPIEWVDAPGSAVQPGRVAIRFLIDVLAVRIRAMTGRYPKNVGAVDQRRMRVAIVTAVPPSSATLTEYGHHLVQELAVKPEIDEVIVFAEDSSGIPTDAEGVIYRCAWTFGSMANPLRILRQVRRDRPDVVFFNMHFTSFGISKLAAALGLCTPALVRLTGAKSVVLLHNIVDTVDLDKAGYGSNRVLKSVLTAIGRCLTRVVLLADTVVTTMPQYVDILTERYGADNVFLTPLGSFEIPTEPVCEPADGPFQMMAFGKFGTYKRVDDLLAAHRLLLKRGHDVECVIAGTDSPNAEGYLAAVAQQHQDLANVSFTGYVAEEDVPALFTAASVVVFPYTSTTGSSGPLHQTGAYARAAVAPRVGDFIDLIEKEGFAAEVFEPGDVVGLADAIEVLIADPLRRRSMGCQNFAASCSLPLAHVTDWHVSHFESLVSA
jgi:glycosyltransferase involved in cell wall biosynthesis